MTTFGGWEMPLRYEGTIAEHSAVRRECGLFDVSHLGVVDVTGAVGTCASWLETLVPAAVSELAEGQMAYSALTLPSGGLADDVVVSRLRDRLRVVVNAERTEADVAYLAGAARRWAETQPADAGREVRVELRRDLATLALAGPAAEDVLVEVAFGDAVSQAAAVRELVYMSVCEFAWRGEPLVVARAGYTGEDGFEIAVPLDAAVTLARALLADERVTPAGLGARDTLRLEAGLCLYGADIDETTTLAEAGLGWTVPKARRQPDAGYVGAEVIAAQLADGAARRRVGIAAAGRRPIRAGASLWLATNSGDALPGGSSGGASGGSTDEPSGRPPGEPSGEPQLVGHVTSGGYSPSLGRPIAMGYVLTELASVGTQLVATPATQGDAPTDGRTQPCEVAALPFVPHRYRRAAQR